MDLFRFECLLFEDDFVHHQPHRRLDRARQRFRYGAIRLNPLGSRLLENEASVRFDCARDVLWIEIQALLALESLAA